MESALRKRTQLSLALFVTTIFLSAFLLFQVQPLIAKHILPWFGGAPGVWTVCMLFFQILLLAGYAYAHYLDGYLSHHNQALVHIIVLILSVLWLPIIPDDSWQYQNGEAPIIQILLLLLVSVGMPYFVLSTTGILLQAWFRDTHPGNSPYPLYAVSNTGSLLALLSYPLLIEVWWSTDVQGKLWSVGFGLFVLLNAAIILSLLKGSSDKNRTTRIPPPHLLPVQVDGVVRFLWLALPALGTMMLLAFTNHLTQNVAVVPFLWILPLALYLLSFILCFESDKWYRRNIWWTLFIPALTAVGYSLYPGAVISLIQQVILYNIFFFIAAMICHGELVKLRPYSTSITVFYLYVAAGGALGGIFVAVIAPFLFSDYLELHTSLGLLYLLAPMAVFRDKNSKYHGGKPRWIWGLFVIGGILLGVLLYANIAFNSNRYNEVSRSFFGVLRVQHQTINNYPIRKLIHGNTMHGTQFLDEGLSRTATSYYATNSGVGQVMNHTKEAGTPRRIGIIGLGVGTLASYGETGDTFRFYEINPNVARMAHEHFSYLSDSYAEIEIILGDARKKMGLEPDNKYDILVLDAFSSDAIPVHLLTKEAFSLYNQHIKKQGIICVHISNRHLNLEPIVKAAAKNFDLSTIRVRSHAGTEIDNTPSDWMVLSRDSLVLANIEGADATNQELTVEPIQAWTDKYSNIFTLLKR